MPSLARPVITMGELLEVSDLAVSYGGARVIEEASLSIYPGEVAGLAGRNGAGKTSLLRAIAGLVPRGRTSSLRIDGRELPRRTAQVARAGVILVPEGRALLARLSVLDNLRFGAAAVGKAGGRAETERVLSLFPDITNYLHRPAGSLSGGQQQLVAVARGVMAQPRLLMIDEMSLGLSPKAVATVLESVQRLKAEGIAVLLVDQNVRSLTAVCDQLSVLADGRTKPIALTDDSELSNLTSLYF